MRFVQMAASHPSPPNSKAISSSLVLFYYITSYQWLQANWKIFSGESCLAVFFRGFAFVNYRQACVSTDNDRISDLDLIIVLVIAADILKNLAVDID